MVVTHTHAKDQGKRSVGSKIRVETDRWEAIASTPVLTRSLTGFVQIVKNCFPGLAKTKFQGFPGLTKLVFKDFQG